MYMYKINDFPSFRGLVYNVIVSHRKVKNAPLENIDGKEKTLKVFCVLDLEGKKIQVTTKSCY